MSKFSHLAGLGAVDGGWGEAKSVRATLRGGSAPAPGARRAAATASNHRQREWLNMSKAIDKVRATEAKELKKKGIEVLKHARWCVLKRPKNLTEKQETKLAELARWNLKTFRAYLLKEDFQGFWNYVYPAWAGKFLDRWCTPTMRSRIEPMKKIARSLRKHRPLILNWFKARGVISLGAVEGLNTRLKLTVRKLTDLLIS